MPDISRIPSLPYLSGRCQRFSNVGDFSALDRIEGRINAGLGLRALAGSLLGKSPKSSLAEGELGEPSRFAEGQLVRVRSEAEVRGTLDARARLRGLDFGPQQWPTCGRLYRVTKVVRRIIDDGGTLRRVSRTVLLEGVHCDAGPSDYGCGRRCPMMYRDEWLEAADESLAVAPAAAEKATLRTVRVKSLDAIARTLDPLGRRENLMFMPEMARFAGQSIDVHPRIERAFELGRWVAVRAPVYVSASAACSGAVLGADGPCDRQCLLVWHADWLELA